MAIFNSFLYVYQRVTILVLREWMGMGLGLLLIVSQCVIPSFPTFGTSQ